MNPRAAVFVPRFGSAPASTAAPATPPTTTATSWEDEEDTTNSSPPPAPLPVAPVEEEHKPTVSVFTVTEDDFEPEPEEEAIESEIKKLSMNDKEEDDREPVNVVFIGHVDAGKSTISGQIMVLTGQIDERTLQKLEKDAKDNNRESWLYAYINDTNEEERAKGITVEVGRAHFETTKKRYTILDAPGHKNYVPNMISGAAQADVAILVISARKGEFETGFEKGGQTREHARLVKTIGVKHLIVVINKMDEPTVAWSKERYDECVNKLTPFLKQTGFNVKKDVQFLPLSGFTGANLKAPLSKQVCPWFDGPTLLGALDALPPMDRKADAPLRIPVVDSFKERGTTVIMGKVEAGTLFVGQNIFLMPGKSPLEVTGIATEIGTLRKAKPGENVKISVRGADELNISPGNLLCDKDLVPVVSELEAVLVILELPKEKSLLTAGTEAVLHCHTSVEECSVSELIAEIDLKTNTEGKKRPTFVKSGAGVRLRLVLSKAICVEEFGVVPQLGRFTLRDGGKTIAMGKVTGVGPKKPKV